MKLNFSDFRFESKFRVNNINNTYIKNYFISCSKTFKLYPSRNVNSIYYDTYDLKFVKENFSGTSFRKKLRLRWYDDDLAGSKIEIKIKKNKMNTKIKEEFFGLSNENKIKKIFELNKNETVKKLLLNYFGEETLYPKIQVSYLRDYYYYKGLIITFDRNLTFTDIKNNKITKKIDESIIEIKFPSEKLNIYNDLVTDFPFRISRNSKYVTGMAVMGYCKYI